MTTPDTTQSAGNSAKAAFGHRQQITSVSSPTATTMGNIAAESILSLTSAIAA